MPPVHTQPNAPQSNLTSDPSVVQDGVRTLDLLESGHQALQELESAALGTPQSRHPSIRTLSVLIPVHNERWTVETLIEKVLQAPIELDLEIVVVDDCSTDGSTTILERLANAHDQISLIQHPTNLGKGSAIRTAIENLTGDVAIIQDADLEYDPNDYPALLQPILDGKADAVFGSRFAGESRRIHRFWHSLINRCLTTFCNALNDLNLTDMETCYKVIRTDILRELRLNAHTFTLEPEITTRLAQWGARIFEVPISYYPRKHSEGKKIKASDGVRAIASMLWNRFIDKRFTTHEELFRQRSTEKAQRYNTWLVDKLQAHLGNRVVEVDAGIGNLSQHLTQREHLFLVDQDPLFVATLRDTLGIRGNVHVAQCNLSKHDFAEEWRAHKLDTVFSAHAWPDEELLQAFYNSLEDEGKCILVVPTEPGPNADSTNQPYQSRLQSLESIMEESGFEILSAEQFCKISTLGRLLNKWILRRDHFSPQQKLLFDRIWPFASKLDRLWPCQGSTLVAVGQKSAAK